MIQAKILKMCPKCKTKRDVILIEYEENFPIEEKDVYKYILKSYKCLTCGEMFDTKETLGKNLSVIREEYKRKDYETL